MSKFHGREKPRSTDHNQLFLGHVVWRSDSHASSQALLYRCTCLPVPDVCLWPVRRAEEDCQAVRIPTLKRRRASKCFHTRHTATYLVKRMSSSRSLTERRSVRPGQPVLPACPGLLGSTVGAERDHSLANLCIQQTSQVLWIVGGRKGGIPLCRKQWFPKRLKAPTLHQLVIHLPKPLFTHGQGYMALSRHIRKSNVEIMVVNDKIVKGKVIYSDSCFGSFLLPLSNRSGFLTFLMPHS